MNKCTIWGGAFRNKAFTLIELLAVIVILAIIALIAVPIVLNIIEDSNKKAAEASMENIEEAAKLYYASKQTKNEITEDIIFTCDGNKCSYGNEILKTDGKVPETGTITIEKNGNIKFDSIKINKYYCDKKECKTSRLPDEYQEVEYIESTGTQYIDTDIYPILGTKVISKISSSNSLGVMCGGYAFDDNNTHRFDFIYVYNGVFAIGDSAFHITDKQCQINTDYVVESYISNGEQYLKIDGEIIYSAQSSLSYGSSRYKLPLFTRRYRNSVITYFSGRNYYTKIYENNILIRDFIPCYRKSDSVIGMYDLVEGKFYTNQGTGTFIKGENVK